MSSLKPDGRPPGTPLHTPPESDAQAGHGAKSADESAESKRPQQPRSASAAPGDGMDAAARASKSKSIVGLSPMKVPAGGQVASLQTAPASTTHAKDVAAKTTAGAAITGQKRTAETLIGADGRSLDQQTIELCVKLSKMVDKPEGFKTVVAIGTESLWHGVVCHDLSQLNGPKGIDHVSLARNMATSFTTDEAMGLTKASLTDQRKQGIKLRNRLLTAAISLSPNKGSGEAIALAGTRLVRSLPNPDLLLQPSGKYDFSGQALSGAALMDVAKLHANLLTGAHLSASLLKCHPDHPQMQVLVDAIKQQMD